MQSFSASGFGLHKLCSGLRQVVHSKYMAPAEERLQLLENDSQSEYKESGEESASESDAGSRCRERLRLLMRFFVDLGASVVFWWALFSDISDAAFYGFLAVVGVAMIVWRFYRALYEEKSYVGQDIPYTCAHLRANDRDLFLVATVHISPRAPRDVETVIQSTKPTVAMIELDEERLDRMRKETTESGPSPPEATLQPAAFKALVEGNVEVEINTFAQRAIWNSGAAGENFSGEVVYRPDDAYGLEAGQHRHPSGRDGDGRDFLALVRRGSGNGEFAPFALKAHNAAKSGASALLVVNSEETLPMGRIGVASIWGELRIACTTGTCDFPPLPLLLLNQQHGEELVQLCESGKHVVADFTVKSDPYPRRSLPKKICQGCALILSGIGVMYGIIQCFAVEFLFPPFGSIDTVGSTVLHGASFSLKTWIAFFLAGLCASFITNGLLRLLGSGMEAGAEQAGVVESSNRDEAQAYIMLAIEMYMLPQIYLAVAASRDEAMYQSMVRKCKEFAAESLVVVVGAGHANGILQRVRQSGL